MRSSIFMTIFVSLGMLLYWVADTTLTNALSEIKPRVNPVYERFDNARVLGDNGRGGTDVVAIGYKEIVTAQDDALRLVSAARAAKDPVTITYADLFLIDFDANDSAHISRVEQLTRARQFTCLSAVRHNNVDYVAWRDAAHEVGVGRIEGDSVTPLWAAQSTGEADRGGCPNLLVGTAGNVAAIINYADAEQDSELERVIVVGLRNGELVKQFDLSEAFGPWAHLDVRGAYSAQRDAFYALWENAGNFYMGSVNGDFSDTSSAIFRAFGGQYPIPQDVGHLTDDEVAASMDMPRMTITARKDGALLLEDTGLLQ